MKKFFAKNKFMIQVVVGFIFSFLVFGNVLIGNDEIDRMIANNVQLSVVLFITIILAAFFTNYVLERVKNGMLEKPNLLMSILNILNYQVFLFALLYFFMDTIFNNAYIPMPFGNGKGNTIVNVGILIAFAIGYKLKNKECTTKQWIVTVAISSILILQINYIEMIFLVFYFLVLSLMKKGSGWIEVVLRKDNQWIRTLEGRIALVCILLAAAFVFSGNIYGFLIAFVVMSMVTFIVYQSKAVYLNFNQ